MPYSTLADVQRVAGGEWRLRELTDFDEYLLEDVDAENKTVVDRAIEAADSEIDSYVRKVHATPLPAPPVVIRQVSARIAHYKLLCDRGANVPRDDDGYDRVRMWLEQLASGKVDLGIAKPTPSGHNRAGYHESERAVSRERFKGFW